MNELFLSPESYSLSPPNKTQPSHERMKEPFLRGPIPIRWLQLAAGHGTSALALGIVLWFHRGLHKKDRVPINLSRLSPFGLSRSTASKALARLETANLVKVERTNGKKQIVQILKIKPDAETQSKNVVNVTLR